MFNVQSLMFKVQSSKMKTFVSFVKTLCALCGKKKLTAKTQSPRKLHKKNSLQTL